MALDLKSFPLEVAATMGALFLVITKCIHEKDAYRGIDWVTIFLFAGMLPIALSLDGDGSWRAPMGIVVIGGLIMSTALTLVIVPASFSLAIGAESWLAPRLKRWFTNNEAAIAAEKKPVIHPAE